MKEEMSIEEARAIGKQYAAQGIHPEDVVLGGLPKPPAKAKTKAALTKLTKKSSEAAEATPEPLSDVEPKAEALAQDAQQEYMLKLQAYEQARSEWANGRMSAAELEAHYAIMRRAKDIYISERAIAARGIPRVSQLPRLERDLEQHKLERDDVRKELRDAKREEQALKQENATSRDLKVAAVAADALKILNDPGDFRSIPAIMEKLRQAENHVQTAERRYREERGRQGN